MSNDNLSVDKHCELLSATLRDRSVSLRSNFRLFVQLFSALVGGSAALQLQYGPKITLNFALFADALAILITVACIVLVSDANRSYRRYRDKLTTIAGKNEKGDDIVPPPDLYETRKTFNTMRIVMVLTVIGFVLFNPLGPLICIHWNG
jgi:hypothetical protein